MPKSAGCDKKLAILIPVYNAADTVGQTIASLQQIEDGWEYVDLVVLCDDASTDNSLQVIQRAELNRCPIRVLQHESNRGESATYRTMLASLPESTEWFLILHADDLALPNFIRRNLEILGKCDAEVASVSSNYWVFDEDFQSLAAPERDVVLFNAGTKENARFTALTGCWWHISGALVNRAKWTEFGGRDARLPYSGDWDLLLRWQFHGYTVGHSVIATTKYRQSFPTSISTSWYPACKDLLERTRVALGLPEVFYGRIKLFFAFSILKAGLRRGAKYLLNLKVMLAMNAFKVGIVAFFILIITDGKRGRERVD